MHVHACVHVHVRVHVGVYMRVCAWEHVGAYLWACLTMHAHEWALFSIATCVFVQVLCCGGHVCLPAGDDGPLQLACEAARVRLRALSGSSASLTAMADGAAQEKGGPAPKGPHAREGEEEDIDAAVRRVRVREAGYVYVRVCVWALLHRGACP